MIKTQIGQLSRSQFIKIRLRIYIFSWGQWKLGIARDDNGDLNTVNGKGEQYGKVAFITR